MFIELPTSLAAIGDPAVDLPLDLEGFLAFTRVPPPRGTRPGEPGSRIRLTIARDARQWPWHVAVAWSGPEEECLTFTRSDGR